MRKSTLLVLALLALASATQAASGRRRAVRVPSAPDGPCAVRGLANLHYSTDGGQTWSANAEPGTGAGAWDLVLFPDEPQSLLAVVGKNVFHSADGGCNWVMQHTIVEEIHHKIQIAEATAGRAFIWTEDWVLRYDAGVVTRITMPETIGGIGVNPSNREHVRILGLSGGKAYESLDGGGSWRTMNGASGGPVNSAAFDPSNFQHVLAGVQTRGIRISEDGGRTWRNGAVTTRPVCFIAFVESQPNVVWVTTPKSSQPFVHRSTDGGASLTAIGSVAGVENNVCLPVLVNPHDPDHAVVPFREFHRFDAVTRTVEPWTCCGGRMDRLAWSPDPSRLYLHAGLR
jgi:hypothetical protein